MKSLVKSIQVILKVAEILPKIVRPHKSKKKDDDRLKHIVLSFQTIKNGP